MFWFFVVQAFYFFAVTSVMKKQGGAGRAGRGREGVGVVCFEQCQLSQWL